MPYRLWRRRDERRSDARRLSFQGHDSKPRRTLPRHPRLKPDLILLIAVLLVTLLLEPLGAEEPEKDKFDIAIIIENRVLPNGEAAIDASNAQKRHARRLAQQTRIAAILHMPG